MLKGIEIQDDKILVNMELLKQEAEKRNKNKHKYYMERFIRDKTRLKRKTGWYPEEKKIEVATLYAAGVIKSAELERLTGIKAATIRDWRTSDWWKSMLDQIHTTHDEELVSKMTQIVDSSLDTIQERLINGDYVYNQKTGEIVRVKVPLRDTVKVTSTIVDKRNLLRGKPTSRSETIRQDERLLQLAQEFRKFAQAKEIRYDKENSNGVESSISQDREESGGTIHIQETGGKTAETG